MRRSIDHLTSILRQARPDLPPAEARLIVDPALNVATHVGHPGSGRRTVPGPLHELLARVAMAALVHDRFTPDAEWE